MKKGVGLSGAHRVGKTTLAKACEKDLGLVYIDTDVGAVFKNWRLSPKTNYQFEARMALQWHILNHVAEKYEAAGDRPFITDRTPIDLLAYTLFEVDRDNVKGELETDLQAYEKACFDVLNHFFNVVVIVQPGIALTDADTSAQSNVSFMNTINTLASGLTLNEKMMVQATYIPKHILDLNQRVRAVEESIAIAMTSIELAAVASLRHSNSLSKRLN